MKKATHADERTLLTHLQQIPNVGPATEGDLIRLGYSTPTSLIGADPFQLYTSLCDRDGVRYDRCVIDVFMAAVDFMNGNPPRSWWKFTARRKKICRQQPELIETS